jgi:hypothetical protein
MATAEEGFMKKLAVYTVLEFQGKSPVIVTSDADLA